MRILTVVDYDEMWPALFENERTLLQMTLGKVISRIHHIGSTSVPGLSAKPVIDILIEVANLEELDSLNQAMEGVGYTVRGENGILNRRYFTKGGNQRSHHIHAFATGDAQIIKHLAFRDYLIKHNDVAIQYALMKKSAINCRTAEAAMTCNRHEINKIGNIALFFPVKQVVLRLHRDKSGPTVTLSGMLHFCKAPGFHRRCADITRFSCFNDVMQSLHGLFNRRGVVKAMNL